MNPVANESAGLRAPRHLHHTSVIFILCQDLSLRRISSFSLLLGLPSLSKKFQTYTNLLAKSTESLKFLKSLKSQEMPPRKSDATAVGSRSARTSKDKARLTIKSAVGTKRKAASTTVPNPQARTTAVNGLTEPPPPPPPSSSGESPSNTGNPPDQQIFMDGIERMVRNTMTGVFAEQKEIERAKDFATTTAPVSGLPAIVGIDPPSLPILPPIAAPLHILSRWSWVSQDTIDSIGNGTFDIDGLPKLHRTDELRNAYLKRSKQGFYHPLDGGPAEVVVGTTKLQSSFKDPTTFFLAWNIYMSIR